MSKHDRKKNPKIKKKCRRTHFSTIILLFRYDLTKNEYDGNLFAANKPKIVDNYDGISECHHKFPTLKKIILKSITVIDIIVVMQQWYYFVLVKFY